MPHKTLYCILGFVNINIDVRTPFHVITAKSQDIFARILFGGHPSHFHIRFGPQPLKNKTPLSLRETGPFSLVHGTIALSLLGLSNHRDKRTLAITLKGLCQGFVKDFNR